MTPATSDYESNEWIDWLEQYGKVFVDWSVDYGYTYELETDKCMFASASDIYNEDDAISSLVDDVSEAVWDMVEMLESK